MSFDSSEARPSAFALHGRPRAIVLDDQGMHHPGALRGLDAAYTPYSEITHLASSSRALWIGARRSVYVFARRAFDEPEEADRLVRALLARIAELPTGARQLARMAEIEELARSGERPPRATWGLAAACLVVFALQLALGESMYEVGYFSSLLFNDGDLWRLFTANLIHGAPRFPIHLLLNLLALLVLGTLLERPLGAGGVLWVMGASAVGAMAASAVAGYSAVVGVSGVVFGLAGGLLWLELRLSGELPAPWRLPRRPLLLLLLLNGALALVIPVIAGAAHAGGFAAGWLATAAVGRAALAGRTPLWARAAAATAVALCALSFAAAGAQLASEPDFLASHAQRLAALPGISPLELNDRAWLIAIEEDATPAQIEAALALAERAVAETGREEATVLDTLAEVLFLRGQRERAVATIDEAIALEPEQPYYREQRRRFTGDRPASDRPTYQPLWSIPRDPESGPAAPAGDPGRSA